MRNLKLSALSFAIATLSNINTVNAAPYTAGSDYMTALAEAQAMTPFVNDRANTVVDMADTLACIMREAGLGVTGVANQTFKAIVNEANCGIGDGDRTTFANLTIQSSHADNNSAQDVTGWMEQANGNKFIVQAQITAGPDDVAPWGLVDIRFKRADLAVTGSRDFDPTLDMHGWVSTTQSGNDLVLESSANEIWEFGTFKSQVKATLVNSDTDNVKYVAYRYENDQWSGTSSQYYVGQANANNLWSDTINASDVLQGSAQCKARDSMWSTGWNDRLFLYSDGSEVTLTGDIDFSATVGSDTKFGNVGYWGMWLPEYRSSWDFPGISDANTSRTIAGTESYVSSPRTLDIIQGGGTMWVQSSITLSDLPETPYVNGWDIAQSTSFNGQWDSSNSRVDDGSGTTHSFDTTGTSNGDVLAEMWTQGRPFRRFIAVNDSGSVAFQELVNSRLGAGSTMANSTGVTRLTCVNNCPAPTAVYDPTKSYSNNGSAKPFIYNGAKATTGLPATLYYDADDSGTLSAGDIPMATNFYAPYPNSDEKYYLFDGETNITDSSSNSVSEIEISDSAVNMSSHANFQLSAYNSSDCNSSDTTGCFDGTQYSWEFSPNSWSNQTFVYNDSTGAAITFDQPKILKFTYDAIGDDVNGTIPGNGTAGQLDLSISEGGWDPINGETCSSSSSDWDGTSSCTPTLNLGNYVGQQVTTEWGGRSLWLEGFEDGNLGMWIRALNPASGSSSGTETVKFTDTSGVEYVHVTTARDLFPSNDTGACTAIALSTVDADHSYDDLPTLGFTTAHPEPSVDWADKPADSTVDQTCIIRSGEIFENGSKVTSCSAW